MRSREEETVAAISTAIGTAGISVIRVSGPESGPIAGKIFEGLTKTPFWRGKSHTIHYGWIHDASGERVDEVLLMWMKGPHSFTGEDTVEINTHGGPFVTKNVLELLFEAGAVPAEPGEFTKRAYLNGKMDLTKAEAVMDLISSETELSLKSSVSQLRGSLFEKTEELRRDLMDALVNAEVNIDYPEYDVPEQSLEELIGLCRRVLADAEALYHTADTGRILREGINTVILGEPNVGKSSLMNALLGRDRAIVTEIPGTTRDTLEEHLSLDGLPLNIVDTAGIRDSGDVVEQIGVSRAREALVESDLVLFLLDGTKTVGPDEKELFGEVLSAGKPYLVLVNKSDIASISSGEVLAALGDGLADGERIPADRLLHISAKDGDGLKELTEVIKTMFLKGTVVTDHTPMITNLRQKESLMKAIEALKRAIRGGEDGFAADLLTIDIREAYDALGEISGHSVSDELADEIFSRFCLGK